MPSLGQSEYYTPDMKLEINTDSPEATEQLAHKLGQQLRGGEVIELVSDLGGGKTTFTRGLVQALGSPDKVASPTFTISKVYAAGRLELHHFDFYRLQDAGLAANELHELIGDPELVIVVEWAEVVAHVLPEERLTITLTRTDENSRKLLLDFPESLNYLVENL